MTDDIREDLLLEGQLLLLSFATGIQDAAAWTDFGCFMSNQTGNALFLTIGAAQLEDMAYSLPHMGMSLGAFIAGGWTVGQTGNYIGVRKRLWLVTSNALQTMLIYAGAAIQYSFPVSQNSPAALGTIFALAFSSGAQVALGRSLKITDITTAMATAAFIDVAADPCLTKIRNRGRNRRLLFLFTLIAGCLVGALSTAAINSTFAIILCAVCKTVATLTFLTNKSIDRHI